MLATGIPPELWPQALEVACDFHDEPFYGQTPELRTYTCRGQAKKGTTHFFRVATAYVIWRQVRLTLAVTYVLPEETVLSVLERLLFRLRPDHYRLDGNPPTHNFDLSHSGQTMRHPRLMLPFAIHSHMDFGAQPTLGAA